MKLQRLFLILCFSWLIAGVANAEPELVDVNNANAVAIAAGLSGIGMARANAIVEYRRKHGPFQSMEDLSQVKGIGEKVLSANKDRIVFGEPKKKSPKHK